MIKMSSIDVKNKIRLDIKEFEEVIVINDDTSATTLVQELRQMASFGPESKFHPNFDQKPLKCIWVKSLVFEIHYFWDKWLMPFLNSKTSVCGSSGPFTHPSLGFEMFKISTESFPALPYMRSPS